MRRIYMDNGATAFPKAPGVAEAMSLFINEIGCNVGRGAYAEAYEAQRKIWELREKVNHLVGGPNPKNVIFAMNITQGLNMIIQGLLKPGDHVLISPMEHNAVVRPLAQLSTLGVSYSLLEADETGRVLPEKISALIQPNTKAIICTHASNVCGTVNPIAEIGKISKEHGLWFIVDAAQTAGVLPVSMVEMQADAIGFTGHKGMLGPQGVGGFVLTDELSLAMTSLITGGTGSHSESEIQPEMLPDKFESGTPNTVGLYGLHAALSYIETQTMEAIYAHEMELTAAFLEGVSALEQVKIIGRKDCTQRTAVVSLDFVGRDNAEISYYLEKNFGIATRVGMHCAPLAHKHLGTFPQGTVRFSFSSFNTLEEIEIAVDAIKTLLETL